MCVTFISTRGRLVEESLRTIAGALKESGELPPQFPPRYIAMKLLEEDSYIKDRLKHHPNYPAWGGDEQAGSATDHQPVG